MEAAHARCVANTAVQLFVKHSPVPITLLKTPANLGPYFDTNLTVQRAVPMTRVVLPYLD